MATVVVEVEAFRWRRGESEEWSGRAERQAPTEQRCPHCGRWFSSRGFDGHAANCYFRENPCFRFDEERERMERRTCAECGTILRWDVPLDEQAVRHAEGCPLRPEG